ncbi:MAG: SpoIIE family protein phosphatase [Candidatus Methylacidiphilales bacterium]|nr:SpoIIE family protein phosphatase [Candidatus Methylacidiphilales bacterium]
MKDPIARYQALIEVARSMSGVMDLDALLHGILKNAREVMEAEACSIFLPDHDTGEMVLHSADSGEGEVVVTIRVPKGVGVAGMVFECKKTVNIQDADNDPRVYKEAAKKARIHTRNMICVPLLNGGNCMGVMQILNAIGRPCFDSQDEEIVEAYAGLMAATLVRLDAERIAIAGARARQELELAREIQDSFLPPPVRSLPTCRIRMGFFPAREIGGDFYFVHSLDDHRTLCGLGDVSGKGVPAALTMARAIAEIRGLKSTLGQDLGAWVTHLNQIFCEGLSQGRFIGMTFLFTDSQAQTMQVCTAGQNPPARSNAGPWIPAPCKPHLPLGIVPGFTYHAESFPLVAGEMWALFSDGITEARNAAAEELTEARFLAALPQGANPPKTFDAMVHAWKEFVGTAAPHDDASLMLFTWRGKTPPASLQHHCCLENLAPGRAFIEEWAKFSCFDDISVGQIVLAVDEAVTNVYRYAYGEKSGPLEYQVAIEDDHLVIRLIDQGTPVVLDKIKGRALDDLRPGGLGTILLQNVFDSTQYLPQSVGTILELRKKIP